MATPAIRALRRAFPAARINALCLHNNLPLMAGIPWIDRLIGYRRGSPLMRTGARLRRRGFDCAILLPNSFRTALLMRLARIPRRIGYDTDARRYLLTERVPTSRVTGGVGSSTTLRSYLHLVSVMSGREATDSAMQLFATDSDRREAARVLDAAGVTAQTRRPWILLNPGVHNGPAKMWPAAHFATLADRFAAEIGATVFVSAAPREHEIVQEIGQLSRHPPVDLSRHQVTLGALKAICGEVDLVVTNDTGPRHIAAAMGTRVVTLFGPTDPAVTRIYYPREVELFERVFCGPCQRKVCPLDHRCMTRLQPERVYESAAALLRSEARLPVVAGV